MLIEFRFKNYACFRDEQTLSLVASSDRSQEENVTRSAEGTKFNLLHSVIIYGANASGKTKLLSALDFVKKFVEESASRKPNDLIGAEPFRLDPQFASAPSEFEVTFIQEKVRYQYGFNVDHDRVTLEYLYAAPRGRTVPYYQRVFDQETGKEKYYFGSSLKGENDKICDLTRQNALFLSVAATFNHPILSTIYQWFTNHIVSVDVNRTKTDVMLGSFSVEPKYQPQIKELLKFADLGITDFRFKEEPVSFNLFNTIDPVSIGQFRNVEFIHSAENKEPVPFSSETESAGTERYFYLSIPFLDALSKGKIVLVDELDASLHPMLTRALVELFHNPLSNKHGAQLIFNSHDTSLLDNTLFRRDQIWFTEKELDGAAHLYSLLEYSPRKGESMAKGYLQGRYGAIPFLGDPGIIFAQE